MADREPSTLRHINGRALRQIYQRILELLERHEIAATFGFVGALCLSAAELAPRIRALRPLRHHGRDWLELPLRAFDEDDFEGWAHPELLGMVKRAGRHEIGAHGGCHLPYDDLATAAESVQRDLEFLREVSRLNNVAFKTLIYPRNVIGHVGRVSDYGFLGYRNIDPWEINRAGSGKFLRVLNEFLCLDALDKKSDGISTGSLRALTPGKFLNARIGVRRIIPRAVTRTRLNVMLAGAHRPDRRIHFYSHPHNFISDPNLFVTLEALLKTVARLQDAGKLSVLTMCEEAEAPCGSALSD